jgi:hypothetical protein
MFAWLQRLLTPERPYAALVLDPEAQMGLVRWWDAEVSIPLLRARRCHHMTVWYDPPQNIRFSLGLRTYVEIAGWAADPQGQAVFVRSPLCSRNTFPHVTVAVAPGVRDYYSNELLAKGYTAVQGPKLYGQLELLRS